VTDDDDDIRREERAIYAIVAAVACPVVIGVAIEGTALDGGAALCLVLASLAIAGIVAGARAITRSRLPRARIHDRHRRR
jgi:hypothetical protein